MVSCGYGFYWGFVEQDRLFLASQEWFIKLAGTLGSLVFTAVLFFLLYRNQSQTLRYFARQSLKTLSYYTLIYYPIFSAVTFIGDWRVIYDFGSTPLLSGERPLSTWRFFSFSGRPISAAGLRWLATKTRVKRLRLSN